MTDYRDFNEFAVNAAHSKEMMRLFNIIIIKLVKFTLNLIVCSIKFIIIIIGGDGNSYAFQENYGNCSMF